MSDAVLAKVAETPAGADLAMTNPGGLRADLLYAGTGGTNVDGVITYAEANAVLPFVNNLSSVTLTGAQVTTVLEQQWQRDADGNVPSRPYLQMGVSKNVSYAFDPSREEGDRITGVTIDGEPIDPDASYRVAVPSFLASGGDNFHAFTEGTAVDTGLVDYEAWIEYLEANDPVSPDFARRSLRVQGLAGTYDAGAEVSFSLPQLDLTSLGSPANTTVTVALVQGETETALGEFAVSDGAASGSLTLPAGVSGDAVLRVVAQPTGTTADLPITIEGAAQAEATVEAVAPPIAFLGWPTGVGFRVQGDEGPARGTVTVTSGEVKLGTSKLVKGYGVVLIDPRKLGTGTHTLTVRYDGGDTYGPSETTVKIVVVKAPW